MLRYLLVRMSRSVTTFSCSRLKNALTVSAIANHFLSLHGNASLWLDTHNASVLFCSLCPRYCADFSLCVQAQKLALRGVTILAASGDRGVSDAQSAISCGYNPSFPASSPFVTAVGATQGPESGVPETACQVDRGGGITTGGGFSNIYPAPSWQVGFTESI